MAMAKIFFAIAINAAKLGDCKEMIISEKQIMLLINIAEKALSQGFFDEKSTDNVKRFLNEIHSQQSEQLKEVK